MERFEAYFQRADLDKDGRITGQEAVAFLQGSNLPRNVLAQIWMHSDRKNIGYLGRMEFYNALRLVTVAQSGRELTNEIVRAAIEGPAAARIPPPQITNVATSTPNPMFTPRPPVNNMMTSSGQMTTMPSNSAQNISFRTPNTQVLPNLGTTNQSFPPLAGQFSKPPAQISHTSSSFLVQSPSQGFSGGTMGGSLLPNSSNPNSSNANRFASGISNGITQISRDVNPSMAQHNFAPTLSAPTNLATQRLQTTPPQTTSMQLNTPIAPSQSVGKDVKSLMISGNGLLSDSAFEGNAFSITQQKQDDSLFNFSTTMVGPNKSNIVSANTGSQLPIKSAQDASSLNVSSTMVGGSLPQKTQLPMKQDIVPIPRTTQHVASPGMGTWNSDFSHSQASWPKMTQSNIQKYTKVFVEVDKDKDGKITGEEARNLFLSWKLPREVLKKVWDLSDQDGDSMLSLKEFCFALYLMEWYREGHPLPAILPDSVKSDTLLLQATSQHSTPYDNLPWQPNSGLPQQGIHVARSVMSDTALKPQQKVQMVRQTSGQIQHVQQKSTVSAFPSKQFNNEEQNTLSLNLKVATDVNNKVQQMENEIMDSKEKMEFYRTKMQDLVLYKSRCDNILNEITEKASGDKREVESLAKKYEEKYKQVGDLASKLAMEEAQYRDIQERKLELSNAIIKIEQGGSADGLLQVRADRIQSHLEELMKALSDRCKKIGLNVKPTAMIELPFDHEVDPEGKSVTYKSWQPGIPEGATDWDEEWDKFEDDGFVLVKDFTIDSGNVMEPKSSFEASENSFKDGTLFADSLDHEKHSNEGDYEIESDSVCESENASVRSPPISPTRSDQNNPNQDIFSPSFDRKHYDAPDANIFDDKLADDSWDVSFDSNSDTDSLWAFDTFNKNKQNSFDAGGFGLNPIKTGSPSGSSAYEKQKKSFFDNSVPASPMSGFDPSPRYNDGLNHTFDSSSRFDSFNAQTSGNFARFDSIRSSSDFDSSDFFSQNQNFARFDSISSTSAAHHNKGSASFDESDPFGTGPFRSSESHTSS